MATTDGTSPDLSFLTQKYEEEKNKRLRDDGSAQYVDLELSTSSHLTRLIQDPWVDHEALNAEPPSLKDGDDIKFLILGAGFCGLIFAARFVEAGFKPVDIRLVDTAGGFGGTWYWNRYPGLMCDSESSIYLPLLEETGFMPKHRYSYGSEIRGHAERIAKSYQLQGFFRTKMETFTWNEEKGRWVVKMRQERGPKQEAVDLTVAAQYVVLANGVLNHPKTPKIQDLEVFQGETIHTGRWKYDLTGGSPMDATLSKLKDKRVGIIGTGATGIQCATELAKWAKHLYVFQRTPSSVDERGQRETDTATWSKQTSKPGWWTHRNANFVSVVNKEGAEEDLVGDAWTTLDTYAPLIGGPHEQLGMEGIPTHIGTMLAADVPRANRIRQRVTDTVTDTVTAEQLKAWYPTWCKRPCFHDDYLPTFNRPNVSLVQTEPTGVGKATSKGLVVNGTDYPLDILVFGTGYRSPATDLSEPSKMCNATVKGRNGINMADRWRAEGASTLHGLLTRDFPNMFLTGPTQAGASPSITFLFDIMARHAAHIVRSASKSASKPESLIIEPTPEAEQSWVNELISRAAFAAPISVCLPSYINNEGQLLQGADAMKAMRSMAYPLGINAYAKRLSEWRDEGNLDGLKINIASG